MAARRKKPSPRHGDEPNPLRVSGDALYNARERAALNQLEVAVMAKVSPRLVSQLEGDTGPDCTIATLGRIAKALNVEPAKLLTTEPRPKQRKSRY